MEELMNVAGYIYFRYQREYNNQIDEMKFHKVMYFAQRESLIQTDDFLFKGKFYGWKYGPVLKEIRTMYINNSFNELPEPKKNYTEPFNKIMDKVFSAYVPKNSWTLSMLSHNEISWKNSRKDVPADGNGDNVIEDEDIRKDAARMKFRREVYNIMRG